MNSTKMTSPVTKIQSVQPLTPWPLKTKSVQLSNPGLMATKFAQHPTMAAPLNSLPLLYSMDRMLSMDQCLWSSLRSQLNNCQSLVQMIELAQEGIVLARCPVGLCLPGMTYRRARLRIDNLLPVQVP